MVMTPLTLIVWTKTLFQNIFFCVPIDDRIFILVNYLFQMTQTWSVLCVVLYYIFEFPKKLYFAVEQSAIHFLFGFIHVNQKLK